MIYVCLNKRTMQRGSEGHINKPDFNLWGRPIRSTFHSQNTGWAKTDRAARFAIQAAHFVIPM